MDLDKLLPSSDNSLSDWSSDISLSDGIPDDFYVQTARSSPTSPTSQASQASQASSNNR